MNRVFIIFILINISVNLFAQKTGSFTDPRDGKTYKTIVCDTQTWFAENLTFKPGTGNIWCLDNDQANITTYGYLYDWETAKNSCPAGWHLPTESEFMILVNFLGGEKIAGGKLKSMSEWAVPNTGADDEIGFAALPGGMRELNGTFTGAGNYSDWWSSSESGGESARILGMRYNGSDVGMFNSPKKTGHYIRCLKN